ncbi:hypothetical protein [Rhizobium leucaenae]|uniref:hypothetical protein n=1 Tax=Rhizobium leucaenae TaxID=29450 RepID=UPI0007EE810D|nr:hypothetical protein [Rhizobium leucaenae]MBB6303729.1 hypothetical protein [Rhizobium leucaenae]
MLRAKRDILGGAPSKAIPSLGEIEGRIMILELLAQTALTRLIRLHSSEEKSELIRAIRHAIDRKCHDAKLCGSDRESAEQYAEELLACAQEQAIDISATRERA